jgi:predicted AAA+ superfamily ATPase
MERKIISDLILWKNKSNRKPLILNGARQVGKTFILKEFGAKYYANFVHFNLETNTRIREYFEDDLSPERLIPMLEISAKSKIKPAETLIILDEIQASERALLSLKEFCENSPEYHIVAAGSLLGVAINREKYSFPVGKVDELSLFPMDFEEFLWALDMQTLATEIKNCYSTNTKMPNSLHKTAIEIYQNYLIVGGMPEVVNNYVTMNSVIETAEIQQKIINEYIADMAKYADKTTSVRIRACYNSIPNQLAKENRKFQYKVVQKGGTATIFGEAIEWLNFAGIVLKCQKTEQGNVPISVYSDLSDFKLYMGDVGILTMKSNTPYQIILNATENNTYLGSLTENYVAQCLTANKIPLFYWKNGNTAEVDFIIQVDNKSIPIEVKKGTNTKSKSLGMFVNEYKCPYSIRISQKNFGFGNGIKVVPLYAVFCISIQNKRSS